MTHRAAASLATLLLGATLSSPGLAATTQVPPGLDTLRNAAAAAAPGDTLVLVDGVYDTSASVVVDKSLTIRASGREAHPVVWGGCLGCAGSGMILRGADNVITLQGLRFTRPQQRNAWIIFEEGVIGRLLECESLGVNVGLRNTKAIYVVGGSYGPGQSNEFVLGDQVSETFVLAGARLRLGTTITLRLGQGRAYILGNEIIGPVGDALMSISGNAQIIANRLMISLGNAGQSVAGGALIGIRSAGAVRVRNNIFTLELPQRGEGQPAYYTAVDIRGDDLASRIENNVVDFGGLPSQGGGPVFRLGAATTVTANIIIDAAEPVLGYTNEQVERDSIVRDNNCFNNGSDCGPGNLAVDPLFADRRDYRLAAGSPSIDAAPDENRSRDIDGTRGDQGAYGGSFPIDQYDRQRAPDERGPFSYPLFIASDSLAPAGGLSVSTLGVARLR